MQLFVTSSYIMKTIELPGTETRLMISKQQLGFGSELRSSFFEWQKPGNDGGEWLALGLQAPKRQGPHRNLRNRPGRTTTSPRWNEVNTVERERDPEHENPDSHCSALGVSMGYE